MNLYHRISISATFLQYGINHLDILIRSNVTSFIKGVEVSDNTILLNITASTFIQTVLLTVIGRILYTDLAVPYVYSSQF